MFAGTWSEDSARDHINILELRAVSLSLAEAFPHVRGKSIQVVTDNTTVVGIPEQARGNQVHESMPGGTELVDLVSPERHGPGRETYCGKVQHSTDYLSRGDSPVLTEWTLSRSVSSAVISRGGPTLGGSVRDQTQQPAPTVCVTSTGCRGMGR